MELLLQALTYVPEPGSPVLATGTSGLALSIEDARATGENASFRVRCTFVLPVSVHDAFHRTGEAINVLVEDSLTGEGDARSFRDPDDEPYPGVGPSFIGVATPAIGGQLRGGWVCADAIVRVATPKTPRRLFVRASLLSYLSNAVALDLDPVA